jgi:glycosyltransferase involved in cell wall biosynthesis
MRLAWFSPMPPVRSGVATCTAQLVDRLAGGHQIDVYVDASATDQFHHPLVASAHDFVWRQRRQPYDLAVYQLGNSSHHDYIWPYLFRYPGLLVLHDAHLHHARAAALLRTRRAGDYRTEFSAAHPGANPDMAELAVAGFDNALYYAFPMTRLVVAASRLTAVHARGIADALLANVPGAAIETIRLGHGELVTPDRAADARGRIRARYSMASDAIVFGIAGGLSPEKRIPQVLGALQHLLAYSPRAHLLLVGAAARHYDLKGDVRARGLEAHVTMTGYLESDKELTDHLCACDVSLNLRWPTAREMSGPWLRALAAGLPTITIDLAHVTDVPSLDPRTWHLNYPTLGSRAPSPESRAPSADSGERTAESGNRRADRGERTAASDPVTVAIDILDEDHSLRLAMRRLASDAELRARLGADGRRYWQREHSVDAMLADYRRVLPVAAARPAPRPALPPHLVNDGAELLRKLTREAGLDRAPGIAGMLG